MAVLDRDFNVIYANESAWSEEASQLSDHSAKCYEAFAHRNDPCGTCPATKMYDSPEVQSVACSSGGDGTACGMPQAFPLVSSSGEVESVLVLFNAWPKPAKQTTPVVQRRSVEVAHLRAIQVWTRRRAGQIRSGRSCQVKKLNERIQMTMGIYQSIYAW